MMGTLQISNITKFTSFTFHVVLRYNYAPFLSTCKTRSETAATKSVKDIALVLR